MVSHNRKPIYDDELPPSAAAPTQPPAPAPAPAAAQPDQQQPQQSQPQQATTPQTTPLQSLPSLSLFTPHPTPTDRLADQVRRARLFLYRHALSTENALNSFLTNALHTETRVANTIAGLAPSPASGEKLMPGAAYVGVAAMAGSILARNRGVFLRGLTPLAAGVGAAFVCLPVTVGNVRGFCWDLEREYAPGMASQHEVAAERVERFVSTGIQHSKMTGGMLEEKVGSGRKVVEEWLKKGN